MERWSVPPRINALLFVKYEPLANAAIRKQGATNANKERPWRFNSIQVRIARGGGSLDECDKRNQ